MKGQVNTTQMDTWQGESSIGNRECGRSAPHRWPWHGRSARECGMSAPCRLATAKVGQLGSVECQHHTGWHLPRWMNSDWGRWQIWICQGRLDREWWKWQFKTKQVCIWKGGWAKELRGGGGCRSAPRRQVGHPVSGGQQVSTTQHVTCQGGSQPGRLGWEGVCRWTSGKVGRPAGTNTVVVGGWGAEGSIPNGVMLFKLVPHGLLWCHVSPRGVLFCHVVCHIVQCQYFRWHHCHAPSFYFHMVSELHNLILQEIRISANCNGPLYVKHAVFCRRTFVIILCWTYDSKFQKISTDHQPKLLLLLLYKHYREFYVGFLEEHRQFIESGTHFANLAVQVDTWYTLLAWVQNGLGFDH